MEGEGGERGGGGGGGGGDGRDPAICSTPCFRGRNESLFLATLLDVQGWIDALHGRRVQAGLKDWMWHIPECALALIHLSLCAAYITSERLMLSEFQLHMAWWACSCWCMCDLVHAGCVCSAGEEDLVG